MSKISEALDPQSAGISTLPKKLDADFPELIQEKHGIDPKVLRAIAKSTGTANGNR